MQFNPRQYSPEVKQESDLYCKLAAIELFSRHGKYKAVMTDDFYPDDRQSIYKVDLVLVDRSTGEHVYGLEVERKWNWVLQFPFPDMQFLPRKKEKLDDPFFTYGRPTHFIIFNRDATRHAVIFDHVIRGLSEKRSVKCPVRGMEDLYVIPLEDVIFDYL